MKELFVPYNEALELKKLGFDEPCLGRYNVPGDFILSGCYSDSPLVSILVEQNDICEAHTLAPLFSQAFKFFRERYRLDGHVTFRHSDTNKIEGINSVYYDIEIYKLHGGDAYKIYRFRERSDIKEEAELECLKQLIKIAKDGTK